MSVLTHPVTVFSTESFGHHVYLDDDVDICLKYFFHPSVCLFILEVCVIFQLIELVTNSRCVCVIFQLIELVTTSLPVVFITDLLGPQSLLHRLRFAHSKEVGV